MKNAFNLIAAERLRQITAKGFTHEHDDLHIGGELAAAGASYALYAGFQNAGCDADDLKAEKRSIAGNDWPFERASFNPDAEAIDNLVKAGALIVAEIERLQRLSDAKAGVTSAPMSPERADIQARMQDIGHAVNERLPEHYGFFVFAAPSNGTPGESQAKYVSNLSRENALLVMKEFIIRNGAAEDWMKNIS